MKKIIVTGIACAALALGTPAVSHAMPDFCAGHVDMKDQADGVQAGERSIPACEEAGGQQYGNNAVTPDASPHPDAVQPAAPVNQSELGTYDDAQDIHDDDGLQAADVRPSPFYVPGH